MLNKFRFCVIAIQLKSKALKNLTSLILNQLTLTAFFSINVSSEQPT